NSSRPENGKSFFVNSQAIPLAVDLISQTRFCAFTTALVAKVPKRLASVFKAFDFLLYVLD
ncbi:MAG TPA: hypothetical protein VM912_23160, partial [Terriglobales bacterium]|nr:hypothetical protein [Terriglobales bacterium]